MTQVVAKAGVALCVRAPTCVVEPAPPAGHDLPPGWHAAGALLAAAVRRDGPARVDAALQEAKRSGGAERSTTARSHTTPPPHSTRTSSG